MKKVALFVVLAVTVIGCSAKKPVTVSNTASILQKNLEIINPPRPHAEFKWLLVVEHNRYPRHSHYLYTDKYHIFQEPDGWAWILPEGHFEAYTAHEREVPRPDTVIPIIFHSILLSYPEILEHTIFSKSKAPRPVTINRVITFNDPKKIMNFWATRAKKIEVDPKKAKVVFTTETQKGQSRFSPNQDDLVENRGSSILQAKSGETQKR